MDMYELLKYAGESGVSDLFAGANKIPAFRVNGAVFPGEGESILAEDIDAFRCDILTEEEEERYVGKRALLMQGIATSIDALSVGFTIADYGFLMAFVCSVIISSNASN